MLPLAGDGCQCGGMSAWPVHSTHRHAAPQVQRWVSSNSGRREQARLFPVVRAVEVVLNFARTYVADRLLPGQRGALWLCMMQYCGSCTSPRTPEHLLYLYHTHLRSLSWRHLHPDTLLMEQLFNVRPSDLSPPTLCTGLDMPDPP